MDVSQSSPVNAKVVFLGGTFVGKTSILARGVKEAFVDQMPATTSAQFSAMLMKTNSGTISLRIWDTAGQEKYRSLAPMYYQGAEAAIVVFSIINAPSLAEAKDWLDELRRNLGTLPPTWVVGNKLDLENERKVALQDGMRLAEDYKAKYMETSAKSGQNVGQLFEDIADALLQNKRPGDSPVITPIPKGGKGRRRC
jgi:Ras-related protein Rab-5C